MREPFLEINGQIAEEAYWDDYLSSEDLPPPEAENYPFCRSAFFMKDETAVRFVRLVKHAVEHARWQLEECEFSEGRVEITNVKSVDGLKQGIEACAQFDLLQRQSQTEEKHLSEAVEATYIPYYGTKLQALGYAVSTEGTLAPIGPQGDVLGTGTFAGLLTRQRSYGILQDAVIASPSEDISHQNLNRYWSARKQDYKVPFLKKRGVPRDLLNVLTWTDLNYARLMPVLEDAVSQTFEKVFQRLKLSQDDFLLQTFENLAENPLNSAWSAQQQLQEFNRKIPNILSHVQTDETVSKILSLGTMDGAIKQVLDLEDAPQQDQVAVAHGRFLLSLCTKPQALEIFCNRLEGRECHYFEKIVSPFLIFLNETVDQLSGEKNKYLEGFEALLHKGYPLTANHKFLPFVEAVQDKGHFSEDIALLLLRHGGDLAPLNLGEQGYPVKALRSVTAGADEMSEGYSVVTLEALVLEAYANGKDRLLHAFVERHPHVLEQELSQNDPSDLGTIGGYLLKDKDFRGTGAVAAYFAARVAALQQEVITEKEIAFLQTFLKEKDIASLRKIETSVEDRSAFQEAVWQSLMSPRLQAGQTGAERIVALAFYQREIGGLADVKDETPVLAKVRADLGAEISSYVLQDQLSWRDALSLFQTYHLENAAARAQEKILQCAEEISGAEKVQDFLQKTLQQRTAGSLRRDPTIMSKPITRGIV